MEIEYFKKRGVKMNRPIMMKVLMESDSYNDFGNNLFKEMGRPLGGDNLIYDMKSWQNLKLYVHGLEEIERVMPEKLLELIK